MVVSSDSISMVRESCKALLNEPTSKVKINYEEAKKFASGINFENYKKITSKPAFLPLRFDSIEQEINIICLSALLAFGSGFRKEGAATAIQFGVIAIHISGILPDAVWMKKVSIGEVVELFNLPTNIEIEAPGLTGVFLTKEGPLRSFVVRITEVLNETGRILESSGYSSFGKYILDITKPDQSTPEMPRTASFIVEKLVHLFPALNDVDQLNGKDIYILKKAQLLVADLYRKLKDNPRFQFPDIESLTIFSDNVIPSILLYLGVLTAPDDLKKMIQEGKDIGGTSEKWDLRLRAAAVVVCEEI
ncbi:hypothetical protein HK096_000983, partial [Nowakowskiella sp. JEL0078]